MKDSNPNQDLKKLFESSKEGFGGTALSKAIIREGVYNFDYRLTFEQIHFIMLALFNEKLDISIQQAYNDYKIIEICLDFDTEGEAPGTLDPSSKNIDNLERGKSKEVILNGYKEMLKNGGYKVNIEEAIDYTYEKGIPSFLVVNQSNHYILIAITKNNEGKLSFIYANSFTLNSQKPVTLEEQCKYRMVGRNFCSALKEYTKKYSEEYQNKKKQGEVIELTDGEEIDVSSPIQLNYCCGLSVALFATEIARKIKHGESLSGPLYPEMSESQKRSLYQDLGLKLCNYFYNIIKPKNPPYLEDALYKMALIPVSSVALTKLLSLYIAMAYPSSYMVANASINTITNLPLTYTVFSTVLSSVPVITTALMISFCIVCVYNSYPVIENKSFTDLLRDQRFNNPKVATENSSKSPSPLRVSSLLDGNNFETGKVDFTNKVDQSLELNNCGKKAA
jgi:hypothetical protein